VDGTYSATLDNTALLVDSDDNEYTDDASTTYTCEAGFMTLLKLTDGVVNDTKDWQFALYEGPDGFDGTQVGSTSSTFDDADGVLEFGSPALNPNETYTVCELGVPAGWSTAWKADTDGDGVADTIVIPYNPNADDNPPANLGNYCFDFGAGTGYPVEVGETLVFEVDNTFPGGEPRTIGYWKNWNSCTGGNQVETAIKNGGETPTERLASGNALLDDVLQPPGITIGLLELVADDNVFDCDAGTQNAVIILDKRDLNGKKRANDAAYALAAQLLAAIANETAGAGVCPEAGQAISDAQVLLDDINFNGEGGYLRPSDALYTPALDLASMLDQYNNGTLCTP
jgi:hypothetical protein